MYPLQSEDNWHAGCETAFGSVPGFTFLASMISIFSGAQLFALGIFGEYLARVHFRAMDRPPYLVGESAALTEPGTTLGESVSSPMQENGIV